MHVVDPTDQAAFQAQAQKADEAVYTMLETLQDRYGGDSRAIAAGALFAVVRWHKDIASSTSVEALQHVMLPALTRTIREVVDG